MKYLYLALSSIIFAYIIIVLFTYLYQRKLLYHPSENNYTGDEIQFEYKVNPAKDAPTYFCNLVYKEKAIILGEIAANITQNKNV